MPAGTDDQVTKRQIDAARRFFTLLPRGHDLASVILKGHLLVEEQVRQIIDERVKKPDALKDARLECYQAICIAESFFSEKEEYIWNAFKKLNKIRNELAHKTEPVGVDNRIDDFVKSVSWGSYVDDRQERIELALMKLFVAVSDLVERPIATVHLLVKGNDEVT